MPHITLRSLARRLRVHPSRIAYAPAVESASIVTAGDRLMVRGLLCGVCAARTESALRSVEGVQSARVDLDTSEATLVLSPGASVSRDELQRALDGVAIAMPVRRVIERGVTAFRTRTSRAARASDARS